MFSTSSESLLNLVDEPCQSKVNCALSWCENGEFKNILPTIYISLMSPNVTHVACCYRLITDVDGYKADNVMKAVKLQRAATIIHIFHLFTIKVHPKLNVKKHKQRLL